jgi:hypothetical protein
MRTHRILFFFFLLLSWVPVQLSMAQSTYLIRHYTKQDYHGGSQNWSVDAGDRGFVYVANNSGLLMFDGTGWKTIRYPGQAIVRSVYSSPDKRIYTGSFEEFGYWELHADHEFVYTSLKPAPEDSTLHNSEIWKIVACGNKIYFQGFSCLFVYDHKTVKPIPLPGNIIFLLEARGRLFVQAVNGNLYEVINDRFKLLETGELLTGTEVKTILPFLNNTFLIGTTSKGIFLYDGNSIQPWKNEANEQLSEYQINNGIVMGDHLVFGTIVKGLFILDFHGRLVHHLHNENALQNNTVLSLCSDHHGSLWVGLDKGIDNVFFDNMVDVYQEKGEQLGAVYTAALVGKRLYVGTNRGIFTYDAGSDSSTFTYAGFLPHSQGQVWELKVIDGRLFCGHTAGTYLVEGNNLKKISGASGGFCLQKLLTGQGEYLAQSTYSPLVIYKKQDHDWVYSHNVKGYLEPSRFMETDHHGNIWVVHAVKGLYKLHLSESLDSVISRVEFGRKNGLPSDFSIRVFKIDNRLVFTTGSKLFTWDDLKNKIIPFDEVNLQLQGFEAASRIIGAGDDTYWFILKNDIGLFKIAENKATLLFRLYLPLYSLHMVDDYENVIPLNKYRHLICLDNGFAIFNTRMLRKGTGDQAELVFRDIWCRDASGNLKKPATERGVQVIPHAWNTLSVSFTSLNSRHLVKLFQYKLEGIENEWSGWSENAEVTYTRLPKGDYKFVVRTLAADGRVTDAISLNVRIKPAWYDSSYAYLGYLILVLAITLLSRHLFRRRVIRHHERLRLEDEVRSGIEKQQAEQEIIKLQNENLQTEISYKNLQLADSTMAIIKKNELLIEIKDELDRQRDKIGSGYPSRYFDRLMNLINKNISTDNDWKVFETLFDQAHENFFKRLKTVYPDLTQSDLKLCAYLKLNLSSKEIAPLLNISFRGVETRRYRLRQRMALDSDKNLVEFIMQF